MIIKKKEKKRKKNHIENEIRETCKELQDLVDKELLPKNEEDEVLVFLYDIHHYMNHYNIFHL